MSCGGSMKKMQNGGRTISEKAAERKSGKGKGLYVSSTSSYIPYTKAGQKEVKETGGTEVYNLKPERKVMKKMAVGGTTTKRIIKKSTGGMYGIPQENMGTSGQYGFGQKGGTVKKPLKKTRIIDSKIPMKGPGAPVYKPLLAKKGGTHKMPNGKVMLNSKMKTGGIKKSLPKAQYGTPFQQYMKIPGAVASDTSNIYNTPKSGSTLDNAFSATYGNDYKQKAIDYRTLEKFRGDGSEYKKPLKKGTVIKKTGGATKATKFAALAPPYNKATFADKIVGAKKSAKKK